MYDILLAILWGNETFFFQFSVAALTQNGSPASSVASRVASAVGAASEVAASLAAANITDLDAADL